MTRRPFTDKDIDRIGRGLAARTLPRVEWTHAAHFAAAFWVLGQADLDAARDMPGLIRAYNLSVGGQNTETAGYHETITQASLRAARAWIADHADVPRPVALEALLGSLYGSPGWLLAYWSRDVLFSPAARLGWIEPDLNPLPF